ncbi:lipid droplet-associated hydrolase isoform X3 [Puntigrus tetrazona]|nr:lipid droplet-associated hydrolase isoform X3 [Puntigrus tetrazona]
MCSSGSGGPEEDASVEYVYCRGAITELLKYGPTDLHAASKRPNPPKMLILVIPGNPGVVGFYKTYMWTLYQTFIQRYPVWAVSHAGHCMPPETYDMIEDASVTEKEDVFGLNGQIEHKMAFLRKHVPRDTNLLLIGHSIGCYIILEMMKRDPELKVVKAVMLFPTIERMACSPQGKVMTPVLCRLRYAFYLPIFLLSLLPEKLKVSIVHLALRNLYALDTSIIPATVSLINVDCAANGMYMGSQEMRLVVERDNATVRQHLSKCFLEFSTQCRTASLPAPDNTVSPSSPGVVWNLKSPGNFLNTCWQKNETKYKPNNDSGTVGESDSHRGFTFMWMSGKEDFLREWVFFFL